MREETSNEAFDRCGGLFVVDNAALR